MDFYWSNPQDLSTLDLPLIDLLMVMVGKIDWDEFLVNFILFFFFFHLFEFLVNFISFFHSF